MPIRVPHHTVVIHRKGRNIRPLIGKPFDFTVEEVADIEASNSRALRRAVVENLPQPEVTSDVDETEVDDDVKPDRVEPPASSKGKGGKGGKPASVAPAPVADEDEL